MEHINDLTSLEVFGVAIREEKDMQQLFNKLADMCENDVLKERFINMFHEAVRNQTLLEKEYAELFPDVELALPPSKISSTLIGEKTPLKLKIQDVLQLAVNLHKKAREFYLDMAESVTDLSGKRILRYLADMKFSHQMMLTAELEMIEKYPSYYNNEESWDAESRLKAEKIKHHEK